MDKFELLKHYWGYSQFRPLQEKIIDAVLEGKDVLGLLPTGGGKSLLLPVAFTSFKRNCPCCFTLNCTDGRSGKAGESKGSQGYVF